MSPAAQVQAVAAAMVLVALIALFHLVNVCGAILMKRAFALAALLASASLLTGCAAGGGLAAQATDLAKAVTVLEAGCDKTVDITLQATGLTPPAGTVHVTKTCHATAPAAITAGTLVATP